MSPFTNATILNVSAKVAVIKVIENKTARLIIAPVVIASLLNGSKHYEELYDFSKSLGFIFQFTDDLLDDKEENINSLKVYSKEELLKIIEEYKNNCLQSLTEIENNKFLIELTNYICKRKV